MNEESLWSKIKRFINSYENGQTIKRQEFFSEFPDCSQSSFDIYRLSLTKIKVLAWHNKGEYIKLYNIPDTLTTTKMHKFENVLRWKKPDWKDWFMDHQDRLNRL